MLAATDLIILLREPHAEARTVLAALHDLRPALDFFPHAMRLDAGRLTAASSIGTIVLSAVWRAGDPYRFTSRKGDNQMRTTDERRSENAAQVRLTVPESATPVAQPSPPTAVTLAVPAEQVTHPDQPVAAPPTPPSAHSPLRSWRTWLLSAAIVMGVAAGGYVLVPLVSTALNTVSTDDAYVNCHVTFIAPRVAGHVTTVLVDNNQRVKAGDLLAQLDKEPYQVQVDIKTSAVLVAKR